MEAQTANETESVIVALKGELQTLKDSLEHANQNFATICDELGVAQDFEAGMARAAQLVDAEATAKGEFRTTIWHEGATPECCGCWNITYSIDGLKAVCNECDKTVDLVEVLKTVGR